MAQTRNTKPNSDTEGEAADRPTAEEVLDFYEQTVEYAGEFPFENDYVEGVKAALAYVLGKEDKPELSSRI